MTQPIQSSDSAEERMLPSTRYSRAVVVWSSLLLLAGLGLTGFGVTQMQDNAQKIELYAAQKEADLLEAAIRQQFSRPSLWIAGLRAPLALTISDDSQFISKLRVALNATDFATDFATDLPGTRDINFIRQVRPIDKKTSSPDQPSISAITVSPHSGNIASGFSVSTPIASPDGRTPVEPEERSTDLNENQAIESAIATGETTLSGLVTSRAAGNQQSVLKYFSPMYNKEMPITTSAERADALLGLVEMTLHPKALLEPLAARTGNALDFELFDGIRPIPDTLLYTSHPISSATGTEAHLSVDVTASVRNMLISGRQLTLRTTQKPAAAGLGMSFYLGLGGASISLLLASVLWLLLAARGVAEARARSMTSELDRLAMVVRRTSNTVIITDADKNIVWVNEAFTKTTGYTAEEALGKPPGQLLQCEQTDPATVTLLSTALADEVPCQVDLLNRSKDGRIYWVNIDIQPMRGFDDKLTGFMAVESDITATKTAQVELAQERLRLQNILRGTDVGTWEWNIPNGEVRLNERWAAITGHTLADLTPISIQTWINLIHPDDLVTSDALLKQHFAGEIDYYECEVRMRHAKGHWVWVLSRGKSSSQTTDGRVEWMAGTIMDITTRKHAVQAVQDSEAFLDRVGRIAGVGGWEYNLISGALTWSEHTKKIHEVDTNYKPELAQAIEFYAPAARPQISDAIDEAINSGKPWDLELPFVTQKGRAIWVRAVGEPVYENGKPVRLFGAFQDVTERRQLEEGVRNQNAMMQAILATIPLGISVFDGDLNLVLDNSQFRMLLNLPDRLFNGSKTTFENIIRFNAQRGEYGAGNLEQTVSAIVERARKPVPHQFERQRPDGGALEVRGAPMPGGGFVTTYSDISERKLAEATLKRTTGTLESILSSATEVAVIAMGMDGVITLFNKGAERLLGYTTDEVVGLQTPTLWHDPEELKEKALVIENEMGRTVSGHNLLMDEALIGKANEWNCIRKNGDRVAVSEMMNLIIDSDYEHRGYLLIGHDITGQKAHENSLREAMRKAEMASQAKGQFLANMSHEIRTPMNAILGMLKLLQNTTLTTRQLDYATKTEGAAQSLLGLLNDILDFSKVEAGKMTLDPHPFRIDRLMRDLSVILSAYVGKKNVEVLFDIDPAVPRGLVGDSSRLQQVLINLGGNAIKFTEIGEVVISVSVVEQGNDQIALRFSVRDSGIGIAPENQGHIFDGFSQAEASTTRRFGGTGLGLSICKRLVDLMGGNLTISSELGKGSTFHFTVNLPVDKSLANEATTTDRSAVGQLRALVVDDNPVARDLMCLMIQSLGWDADAAVSGEAAVALVDDRSNCGAPPYQAIFVDWQMPGMDGWETSLKLRTQIDGASAPIVVMVTAHGREMLAKRTPEEHALLNGFLVKPVTASMLLDAVMDARAAMVYPQHTQAVKTAQTKRLQGLKLLVVEDNAINQQIAQELLAAEGASVQLASNGQLGVEAVLAAALLFDAVLMDIQMPVMDGYTATRTIRRALGSTHLPIIAMTANAMASDQEACREAGMDDHVGKPFDLSNLISTILRHAGQSPKSVVAAIPIPEIQQLPPDKSSDVEVSKTTPTSGIDVAGAISRMGCDEAFYVEIVGMFFNDTSQLAEQLDEHLRLGEHVAAARLLHTLKGLAATVGAQELSVLAAQVEDRLKISPDGLSVRSLVNDVKVGIDHTTTLLQRVIQKYAPTDDKPKGAAIKTSSVHAPLDNKSIANRLQQLDRLLRESDMQATTVHSDLSRDRDSTLDTVFNSLDKAMTTLDFATAREQCRSLIQRFHHST